MKSLVQFIAETKSSSLQQIISEEQQSMYDRSDLIPWTKDANEYTEKVDKKIFFDVQGHTAKFTRDVLQGLQDEFGRKYQIRINGLTGTISFFSKSGKQTLDNKICEIASNYSVNFGPNKKMVNELGPKILKIVNSYQNRLF